MKISDKYLKSGDIELRKITMDDIEDMFEYASQEDVGPNAGWPKHENRETTKKIINIMTEGEDVLGIRYKGKLVGSIGLHVDGELNKLGYVLNHDYWGKGIVKNAVNMLFDSLNIDRTKIVIYISPTNLRSQKVANKLGFSKIGNNNSHYIYRYL